MVRLSRKKAVSFLLILMLMLTGCGGTSGDSDAESVQNSSNAVSDNSGVTEESAAPETESDASEEIADGASEESSKETENQDKSTQSDAVKKEIENVTEGEENHFTCEYDGIEHEFVMYLPEGGEASQSPLVLMLHGYGQTADSFRMAVGFEKEANAAGYTVVYVTGAQSSSDATAALGWNSGIGDSENDDVGFLSALAEYIQTEYGTDKDRTYAVGFSNGAFMTHRLALEASDTFAAVVSVAGMMPKSIWETKPEALNVSILQVTGEKDDVVPKHSDGSADTSQNPAIEDVMDYYIEANGLEESQEEAVGKKSTLTKYTSSDAEGAEKSKQVWNLFIPDGRHSWPDEGVTGININQLIIEFLN